MDHLTTTPFGRRPVTAGLIAQATARQHDAENSVKQALPQPKVADKWQLLRDLSTARRHYGLSDRTLMVLSALLSFHPDKELQKDGDLIVFPSNRALSDRSHGMAESTLRRHLARLVEAGLLIRHDSPNGKRYARRYRSGDIAHAFGFDLTPLLLQVTEITHHADTTRALTAELRLRRERISLLKRDAMKLAEYALENALPCPHGDWHGMLHNLCTLTTYLRRKLNLTELKRIEDLLVDNLGWITEELTPKTSKVGGNDSENERHYQNSNKDSYESEQHVKLDPETSDAAIVTKVIADAEKAKDQSTLLPLPVILSACSEVTTYHPEAITNWRQLVEVADRLRTMMGINDLTWRDAMQTMGPEAAAVTVCCILQRFDAIRNPAGYLRTLSAKALDGKFSTAPMVMALINTSNSRAA